MKIINGLMLHCKSDLLPDYFNINILQIEISNNMISNESKLREKHQGSFGHVKRHKSGAKQLVDVAWKKSGGMSQVEKTHRKLSGMAKLTSIWNCTFKLSIPNTFFLFSVYELTVW